MDCVQPRKKSPSECLSLLIPTKFTNVATSKLANERPDTDDLLTVSSYEPYEDIFLSLAHAALKIRLDLMVSNFSVSVSKMPLTVFQTVCTCSYDSYLEVKNFHMEKLLRRRKLRLGEKCFYVLKTLSMG